MAGNQSSGGGGRANSGDLDSVIDLTGANAAAASGMPDPGALARLAGEFFGALNRGSSFGSGGTDIAAAESMLRSGTGGVGTMPSTGVIPTIGAAAPMPTASMPTSTAGMPTSPGYGPGDMGSIPGLGFLGDIRSLDTLTRSTADAGSMAGASGAMPTSASGMPGSEQMARSAPAQIPAIPGVQAVPSAQSAGSFAGLPTMPGIAAVPSSGSLNDPSLAGTMPTGTSVPQDYAGFTRASNAGAMPFGISLDDLGSPQLPSATTPIPVDRTGGGFTQMLRPLDPLGLVPNLAPIESSLTGMSAGSSKGGASNGNGVAAVGGLGGLKAADISSIPFDVQAVRRDFPILSERVNGRPLIWLDNAATTQKPQQVIDRLVYFYQHENSNVHRAAHTLAARSTDAFEGAREKVRRFINAPSAKDIIFVRGTTEGINLVAQSWGRKNINAGDEVVVSHLEHHANIVPWQMICSDRGAKLRVAPVDDTGQVMLEEYEKLLNARTKIVAFSHVSNALGTITPAREMIQIAHRHGARVLLDGAQSIQHMTIDVQGLDCDFFVFSGHKLFGPTGIGAVYGKQDVLESMPPYQGGGNMIADVTFERTVYHAPPLRFEAGTGNIADAVGLGAAIDYLTRLGMPLIERYEHDLHAYGTQVLSRIPGLRFIGTAKNKTSVLSFILDGYRTEDVGQALAAQGIAVRAGHHCAQPILRRFGVESTVRPSIAFYNTCEELDELAAALRNIRSGRVTSVV